MLSKTMNCAKMKCYETNLFGTKKLFENNDPNRVPEIL